MKTSEPPVVVTQEYPVNASKSWAAITEHERMLHWYFNAIPAFKPEVEFYTEFMIENEVRQFSHQWTTTGVIPEHLITYRVCQNFWRASCVGAWQYFLQESLRTYLP